MWRSLFGRIGWSKTKPRRARKLEVIPTWAENEFAHEINIKPTVLSQYINSHRNPPQDIIIRLELHSRNNIPAATWYRLLEKENIHDLNTNLELRTKQKKYISKKALLV